MSKIIRTSITFDFYPDEDIVVSEENMSDEELMQYFKNCTYEDITSYVKYNELMEIIDVEIINENN